MLLKKKRSYFGHLNLANGVNFCPEMGAFQVKIGLDIDTSRKLLEFDCLSHAYFQMCTLASIESSDLLHVIPKAF